MYCALKKTLISHYSGKCIYLYFCLIEQYQVLSSPARRFTELVVKKGTDAPEEQVESIEQCQ